jgi:hypothetical protein
VTENLADLLALAAEQLSVTWDRLGQLGVTANDSQAVTHYLEDLTEHGLQVCAVALRAIERAGAGHSTRARPEAVDLQASLAHAMNLLDAAMHFVGDAQQALSAMSEGDATS